MKLKTTLIIIAVIIAAAILIWFFAGKFSSCGKPDFPATLIIHDTTTIIRYEYKLSKDTVIKWFEKPIYVKVEPEKIFIQKVDTVFIERTKDMDVMLHVKKQKTDLWITAVNQNGRILKEYIYHNVGDDFTATSQFQNIFVKSKQFEWEGISPLVNYKWQFLNENWKHGRFETGLKTGVNYLERYSLNLSIKNPLTQLKDTELNLEASYNFLN